MTIRAPLLYILITALTTPGVASGQPGFTPSAEDSLLQAAKAENERDSYGDIQLIESNALAQKDAAAERQGDRLVLRLASGEAKSYVDSAPCDEVKGETNCFSYHLLAHAASRHVFVLMKLYYEGADWIVVDDVSGDQTVMRSFPNLSPSGQNILLMIVNDDEVGFGLQIWRRQGHKYVLDWSRDDRSLGAYISYKLLEWPSEDTIKLQSQEDTTPGDPPVTKVFDLHYSGHHWAVLNDSSSLATKP